MIEPRNKLCGLSYQRFFAETVGRAGSEDQLRPPRKKVPGDLLRPY
jgi:hypothetical protein